MDVCFQKSNLFSSHFIKKKFHQYESNKEKLFWALKLVQKTKFFER